MTTKRERFIRAETARDARRSVAFRAKDMGHKVVACRRVDPTNKSRGFIVTTEPVTADDICIDCANWKKRGSDEHVGS
jgi:hypothetical protein